MPNAKIAIEVDTQYLIFEEIQSQNALYYLHLHQ